eukprot:Hpha_TRINITY_DN3044_c0_g1::TRINITY_DN3044_c0_g1_i2::g.138676::m.138676
MRSLSGRQNYGKHCRVGMLCEEYREECRYHFAVDLAVTVPVTLISCVPMEDFLGCSMINLQNALILFGYAGVLVYLRPFLLGFIFISTVLQALTQGLGCLLIGIAFAAESPESPLVSAGGTLFEVSLYIVLAQLGVKKLEVDTTKPSPW